MTLLRLPQPPNDLQLEDLITPGTFGDILQATTPRGKVAIKIQKLTDESQLFLERELTNLRKCTHPNLPSFYNAYKCNKNEEINIWFVLELCEFGSIMNLVKGLIENNRKMFEDHIAFVLREIVKALAYLHDSKIIHRNVRGANIMVTKEGEIKLSDFGLSKEINSNLDKTSTNVGSPGWLAPEIISCQCDSENLQYGNRCDVWSLGITAIELGDGKSPYENMHPSRALFQIVRNPPPTLYRPGNWSDTYNDFINECLAKNPEFRPYSVEIMEHPFLTEVPENDYHLTQEIKSLIQKYNGKFVPDNTIVVSKSIKSEKNKPLEHIYVEDLASLDVINSDTVLAELYARAKLSRGQTYIGDILLVLNCNGLPDIYDDNHHNKYKFKSLSDNSPHIFGVADAAYQAALHHDKVQHIILTGESCSGKTRNFGYLIDHLLYLGKTDNINQERINDGLRLLQAFTNASTPMNDDSTRCIAITRVIFGKSGKNSGAEYKIYQLEKNRISSSDSSQANFHILYYFYDGLVATDQLEKYQLNSDRNYKFLRITNSKKSNRPKDNPKQNVKNFHKIQEILKLFDFTDEQIHSVNNILASILHLGEINFEDIENDENIKAVAELIQINHEELIAAFQKADTCADAEIMRNILANNLYGRIVDFIIALLNKKLWYGTAIFGQNYSVNILDSFGFESFEYNSFQQLIINTFNEQLQYYYNQHVFSWEMLDISEENLSLEPYQYYDNKDALDQILGKPEGLFTLIENSTKMELDGKTITDYLQHQEHEQMYINKPNGYEFCINHYTGKVTYNVEKMISENKNHLPIDFMTLLKKSNDTIIKMIFTNSLNKTGNVVINFEEDSSSEKDEKNEVKIPQMEASNFRSTGIEIMKELATSPGIHFVRCIRSNLQENTNEFHTDAVKQQIQALEIVESSKARKDGYSTRIPFAEFLKRYKFLAFDLNEEVDVTKENCRLLLIRLQMEGWLIGKTKVFLKYYNEEYLQRLYETQVKKIIKVQSIIRSYLVKRRGRRNETSGSSNNYDKTQEDAVIVIQNAYRNFYQRKTGNKLPSDPSNALGKHSQAFIRYYCDKWKTKSIFQVLLQYRASKYQELYNFCQQIHLYNQNVVSMVHQLNDVKLSEIEKDADLNSWIGLRKPSVLKLNFQLDHLSYFDTSHMRDFFNSGSELNGEENWDFPLRKLCFTPGKSINTKVINCLFERNPNKPAGPPPSIDSSKKVQNSKIPSKRTNKEQHFTFNNYNTTPANKEFEYIKPSTVKLRSVNPIVEMQNKCRRESTGDDEPPFNFQAMLRKTNYNPENKEQKEKANIIKLNINEKPKEVKQIKTVGFIDKEIPKEIVSIEIMPGLFLTGVVTDL